MLWVIPPFSRLPPLPFTGYPAFFVGTPWRTTSQRAVSFCPPSYNLAPIRVWVLRGKAVHLSERVFLFSLIPFWYNVSPFFPPPGKTPCEGLEPALPEIGLNIDLPRCSVPPFPLFFSNVAVEESRLHPECPPNLVLSFSHTKFFSSIRCIPFFPLSLEEGFFSFCANQLPPPLPFSFRLSLPSS